MDCIFCKIIKGEIPSYKVYEDDDTLAFLDIAPVNYGHTLVIPKKHYTNIEEITEDDLCAVIKTVKKVGKALKESLGIEGYNLGVNNDPVAGQIVPHLHFHLIPRIKGDGLSPWPGRKYRNGNVQEILEKIKSKI